MSAGQYQDTVGAIFRASTGSRLCGLVHVTARSVGLVTRIEADVTDGSSFWLAAGVPLEVHWAKVPARWKPWKQGRLMAAGEVTSLEGNHVKIMAGPLMTSRDRTTLFPEHIGAAAHVA
jgi:hypothetical protein